jgi:membrane-bound ClpP family serine protease
MLFRKFGSKELNFIIPRWAKSAATLLVCSGDKIFMSPVAELGPLDPQITQMNLLEGRVEQFSPLHIGSTLDMIREEFESGSEKLAEGLIKRLQFPITLGGFLKLCEVGEQYLIKLLETRMLSNSKEKSKSKTIAKRLTRGYADHSYCINVDEAKGLGLEVFDLPEEELNIVWELHRLNDEKRKIKKEIRKNKVMDMIKELPPDLLDKLPKSLKVKEKLEQVKSPRKEEE